MSVQQSLVFFGVCDINTEVEQLVKDECAAGYVLTWDISESRETGFNRSLPFGDIEHCCSVLI